jgi:anti-anti-sigma factor
MCAQQSGAGPAREPHRIALWGDVDLDRKDELEALARWYEVDSCADVSLDMSRVTFLDSTGLSFMVHLRNVADARLGHVQVIDPPDCVCRLLRLVNLDGRFLLLNTEAGASDRPAVRPREAVG